MTFMSIPYLPQKKHISQEYYCQIVTHEVCDVWPKGKELIKVMVGFKKFCGLPLVHGAINATHPFIKVKG